MSFVEIIPSKTIICYFILCRMVGFLVNAILSRRDVFPAQSSKFVY